MQLAAGARFCMHCGQPALQSTPADDARMTRLAAGAPNPLVTKIRAASHLRGERRLVTILFADVVGSTALAEKMDVEAWTAVLNRAFDRITPIVYRYEGTIAQVLGDAVWAFFGAPVAHEDDPMRAVLAALDIIAAAKQVAALVREKYGIEFALRVCLNTGPVVVGPVSTDFRYHYTAAGDAVNLASRLKFAAGPMTVLMSESTHRFVATAFECSDLGPVEVSGRSEPVRVYRVIGPSPEPGRRRGRSGLERVMVNRAPELGALVELADTVRAGLGRAVLILGESGIGKTRLVSEWRASTEARPDGRGIVQWAEGGCLSYGHDVAYHLLTDLLRSLVGIPRTATGDEARAALLERVTGLFGALPDDTSSVDAAADSPGSLDVYPYLGHMLRLELEGAALERVRHLDPQAVNAQYVSAMRHLLRKLVAQGPMVIILEDLQWADPSSVEVLTRLLPLALGGALLFCLVTRPDRETPGWRLVTEARDIIGEGLTELRLGALSEGESIQLASSVLEVGALPAQVQTLTVKQAEGNPLFVEELIETLIERGVIIRGQYGWVPGGEIASAQIPDSLQGLLLARIDRLPEDAKRVLLVAAVVGRQFTVKVLEEVLGLSHRREELLKVLNELESAKLLRLTWSGLDLECQFHHGLVQDAAYASLLKSDRQELHLAVGEALERSYPGQLSSCDLAPKLAEHFAQAGEAKRALGYYEAGGEAALACYANEEAESYYRAALGLVASGEERAPLLARLGEALYWQSRFEEAIRTWRESIQLSLGLGPDGSDRVAWLYGRSARAAWAGGDTPGGLRLCQEGLKAVVGAPESAGMALLLHESARAYLFNGFSDQARPLGYRALDIAERLGAVDVKADALATLGLLRGQPSSESIELLERAVGLAESAGLLSQSARAHVNLAATLSPNGDIRAALAHYERAAELHGQRGDSSGRLMALCGVTDSLLKLAEFERVASMLPLMSELLQQVTGPNPGEFQFRLVKPALLRYRGELGLAAELLRSLLSDAREREDWYIVIEASNQLADVLLESVLLVELAKVGEAEMEVERCSVEAEAALAEAIEIAERWGQASTWSRCLFSMVCLCQGKQERAGEVLREISETSSTGPTKIEEAWLLLAQGRFAGAAEDWSEAFSAYDKAAETFQGLGMRWWRARLLHDWAVASVTRGDPTDLERARALWREAAEIFDAVGVSRYAYLVGDRRQALQATSYSQAQAHQQVTEELAMAWRIQEGLLPTSLPDVPGWQLAAVLEPAKVTSGDFYDFVPLAHARWGILVADVAEKGAGAALYMALSRTLIRTYAVEQDVRPESVLAAVNERILGETQSDMFVTVFYGVLEPASGSLVFCNAGHNPPLLLHAGEGGIVEGLRKKGMPLGIFPDAHLESGSAQMEPGDVLLLYTDGVTEAQNADGQLYGENRLIRAALSSMGSSAREILRALLSDVKGFVADAAQLDDLTLVVLVRE